jgi:hypothetical protein
MTMTNGTQTQPPRLTEAELTKGAPRISLKRVP